MKNHDKDTEKFLVSIVTWKVKSLLQLNLIYLRILSYVKQNNEDLIAQ